jgi:hypothetical protein
MRFTKTQPEESRAEDAAKELREAITLVRKAIADLSPGSSSKYGPSEEVLKTMYQEVCRHHDSISEFRGKLLGLVPIASGAFIALIATKGDWEDAGPLLIAAGLVGGLVTFGLYLYEAWQADTCRHLIHHAGFLEKQLHVEAGQFRTLRRKARVRQVYGTRSMANREAYLRRHEQKGTPPEKYLRKKYPRWGAGAETASLVVYGVVIAGWLAVAGLGVVAVFD